MIISKRSDTHYGVLLDTFSRTIRDQTQASQLDSKSLILSDSLNALSSLRKLYDHTQYPLVKEIVSILTSLPLLQVTFVWIPGHRGGVIGNEKTDEIVKQAATLSPIANDRITTYDVKTFFKYRPQQQWKEN